MATWAPEFGLKLIRGICLDFSVLQLLIKKKLLRLEQHRGSLPKLRDSKLEVKVCVKEQHGAAARLHHSLAAWARVVSQPRPHVPPCIRGPGQDLSHGVSFSLKSSSSIGSAQVRPGP